MRDERVLTADLWEKLPPGELAADDVGGPSLTYWQDIRRRFVRNKAACVSLAVILLLYLMAAIGPQLTTKSYREQNIENKLLPMFLQLKTTKGGVDFFLKPRSTDLFEVRDGGRYTQKVKQTSIDMETRMVVYQLGDAQYYVGVDEDGYFLLDSDRERVEDSRKIWNMGAPLGTDVLGRDLLTRMVYGSRISLLVALISTIMTVFLGILYGGISGYYGGNIDAVMMRVVEVIDTVPSMLYIILLMVYLGPGIQNLLLTMVITSWTGMARMVRGQVLSLKQNDYVLAARAMGVKPMKIITSHLIPNCIGMILVQSTARIPSAIFTEAMLSYLGLGVMPPMPSWGSLCNEGMEVFRTFPALTLIPAIAISITMFAFNFLGDGMRDAFDPRLRS